MSLRELIDLSINQVLIRCLFTSATTVLAMLPMALWAEALFIILHFLWYLELLLQHRLQSLLPLLFYYYLGICGIKEIITQTRHYNKNATLIHI